MEIISQYSCSFSKPAVCTTIGFFDGVHYGHQFLLKQLKDIALEKKLKTSVTTFWNHPRTCLQTDFLPKILTSTEEKLERIDQIGIDFCFLLDFTPKIAQMTAEDFIQQVLVEKLNVKTLLIGYDHRFGKDRNEGFDGYVRSGKTCGIDVILAKKLDSQTSHAISSTAIRNKIRNKAIAEANQLSGYAYSLSGTVIYGDQIGRKIDYPTANLKVSDLSKVIPSEGVYAVRVILDDNSYPGMAYIGTRPTVSDQREERIEVHIINFSGNLYEKNIRLEFIDYLRDDRHFDSLEELQKQLNRDKEQTLFILSNHSHV